MKIPKKLNTFAKQEIVMGVKENVTLEPKTLEDTDDVFDIINRVFCK